MGAGATSESHSEGPHTLLTITLDHRPAADFGYLLHKNPASLHSLEFGFGAAHVFYPEVTEERCTVAVLVEVDPVGLVRNRSGGVGSTFALAQYVNDRPYATSSLMSVALGRVFSSAMAGRSRERPELVGRSLPLEVGIPVAACDGGADVVGRLFEPLGYRVDCRPIKPEPRFPEWGPSAYLGLALAGRTTLASLLQHLYVLLPVMDDVKHYWVGRDEIDKLLRRGGDWLGAHPERGFITERYLRHDRLLTREALARLNEEGAGDPDDAAEVRDAEEWAVERRLNLGGLRLSAVVEAVTALGARQVLDLGCGEGRLMAELLRLPGIERVRGVDVSIRALQKAAARLHLDSMTPRQRSRVDLLQGALTYRDRRLEGFDAAVLMEVIEHLDPSRLQSLERSVFHHARPKSVIVTTPNAEYNGNFGSLPQGQFRHRDHRFEWSRAEFAAWGQQVARDHGYTVSRSGVGPEDATSGPPTQMAVFSR